jgi:hypothetical protein
MHSDAAPPTSSNAADSMYATASWQRSDRLLQLQVVVVTRKDMQQPCMMAASDNRQLDLRAHHGSKDETDKMQGSESDHLTPSGRKPAPTY